MKINHQGFAVTDVSRTADMFKKYFGFVQAPGTPNNTKMAFLIDDNGSLITMFKVDNTVYPDIFHIGFMLETVDQVSDIHSMLEADGFNPEAMRNEHGRYTFYFMAPGGFMVEVNSLIPESRPELKALISENIH